MPSDEAIIWDARSELDVAVLIRCYLHENPPPADSAVARDWVRWAERLEADGQVRLAAAGATTLRPVS